MMKKLVVGALALALLSGCASFQEHRAEKAQVKAERESYQNPFYLKYLAPTNKLDQAIFDDPEAGMILDANLDEREVTTDAE